jgi:hypothetical protein
MTIAGAALGIAFAGAGAGVNAVASGARVPLAITLGAITLAYALHELGFIRLPVLGRDWQVPASWIRNGFYRSAVIFGSTVGFGVFTRIPYASLPILLGWLFVSGNVVYGLAVGLVYGMTRAASIYLGSGCTDTEQLVQLNQKLMSLIPRLHQITGFALAMFAAYLLAAPSL